MKIDLTIPERERLLNLFMNDVITKDEYLKMDSYSERRSKFLTINLN